MCARLSSPRSTLPFLISRSDCPFTNQPRPGQSRAPSEINQCTAINTKTAASDPKNGALPVTAREAVDPMMMPRIASNTVARPRDRFLASRINTIMTRYTR